MVRTPAQTLSLQEISSCFDHLLSKHRDWTTAVVPALLQEFKKPWATHSCGNLLLCHGRRNQKGRAMLPSPPDIREGL